MCRRCVMDTTVPDIEFDQDGVCNFCKEYEARRAKEWFRGDAANARRDATLARIKQAGAGREYDCVIGVSGGVDSTYVAYLTKKWGLRPLAVHLDNGWNSELAVSNIEQTMKRLNIDLQTHVLNWDEFRDLQRAFIKSSIANWEIPTDHAIVSVLFKIAARHGVKFILTGGNIATEAIMPKSWMYDARDARLLKAIHHQFGEHKLKTFPVLGLMEMAYYILMRNIKFVPVLNMVNYVKTDAKRLLMDELGWRDYGGKHYESIFTRFFQTYALPRKYNIDKRKAHLSCLVLANEMTRDEALAELEQPPAPPNVIEEDVEFVTKKLGFSVEAFEQIMNAPPKPAEDYPNLSFIWSYRWGKASALLEFVRRRSMDYASLLCLTDMLCPLLA